jgi:zinc transporter ZupT
MGGYLSGFLLGAVAAFAVILGGVFTSRDQSGRILRRLLPLGAGFLLALTLLEMIPTALSTVRENGVAPLCILVGYGLVHLVEGILGVGGHHHGPPQAPEQEISHSSNGGQHFLDRPTAYAAFTGLTIHAFFDGVALGSSTNVSATLGGLLACAIVLHKIPEGATVGAVAGLAGLGRRGASGGAILLGGATLLGAGAVSLLGLKVAGEALALAAGATLYVATDLVAAVTASDACPGSRAARLPVYLLLYGGASLFALIDLGLRLLGFH